MSKNPWKVKLLGVFFFQIDFHSWQRELRGAEPFFAKPPVAQLLMKLTAFYGNRRFTTVFTRALHWSLSLARRIQSISPHPIPLRSILILSSQLRLGLRSGLFASGFPIKAYYYYYYCCYIMLSFKFTAYTLREIVISECPQGLYCVRVNQWKGYSWELSNITVEFSTDNPLLIT
jgi:hypothetical protein